MRARAKRNKCRLTGASARSLTGVCRGVPYWFKYSSSISVLSRFYVGRPSLHAIFSSLCVSLAVDWRPPIYKYAASVISSDTVSKRRTRMRVILGMSRGRGIRGGASRSHKLTERNRDIRCGILGLSVTHFTREGGREYVNEASPLLSLSIRVCDMRSRSTLVDLRY